MLISGALKNKKAVPSQISGSNEPLQRYGHSKLSKMAACRQLGFDVTRNSATGLCLLLFCIERLHYEDTVSAGQQVILV